VISVFTPSHDTRYLDKCFESLLAQTFDNWQWVVVLNGKAKNEGWRVHDSRVTVLIADDGLGVGYYKRMACAEASGDILLELDHDDWLADDALERVERAFYDETTVMVFSDTIQVQYDGLPDLSQYDPNHGWTYRKWDVEYISANGMTPHPHNFGYIWYAPNHLRAFRTTAYNQAGGYNASMKVLDDQDLMSRIFMLGRVVHLNIPLYYQRMHEMNTQRDPQINAQIQTGTVELYHKYIERMALSWSDRHELTAIDLGSYHNKADGFTGVDLRAGNGVDIVADYMAHDFGENTLGVIRAHDFIEHLTDKTAFMEKAYRELVHGGMLLISVPSTDGRGAFQDPTHVSYWNENSFWYYTDPFYADFVPTDAQFQVSYLGTGFPSEWHRQNNISYVRANLIAIKNNRHEYGGINKWARVLDTPLV